MTVDPLQARVDALWDAHDSPVTGHVLAFQDAHLTHVSRTYGRILVTIIGFMASTYDSTMSAVMQLATSDRMRGRVLGLYSLTLSLSPLGGLVIGAVATLLNTPLAVALSGTVVIAGALGLYPRLHGAKFSADEMSPEEGRRAVGGPSIGSGIVLPTPDPERLP